MKKKCSKSHTSPLISKCFESKKKTNSWTSDQEMAVLENGRWLQPMSKIICTQLRHNLIYIWIYSAMRLLFVTQCRQKQAFCKWNLFPYFCFSGQTKNLVNAIFKEKCFLFDLSHFSLLSTFRMWANRALCSELLVSFDVSNNTHSFTTSFYLWGTFSSIHFQPAPGLVFDVASVVITVTGWRKRWMIKKWHHCWKIPMINRWRNNSGFFSTLRQNGCSMTLEMRNAKSVT